MIDQITWNILFEWITGTRCFLPEGCKPPLTGILVYSVLIASLIWIFYRVTEFKADKKILKLKGLFNEFR